MPVLALVLITVVAGVLRLEWALVVAAAIPAGLVLRFLVRRLRTWIWSLPRGVAAQLAFNILLAAWLGFLTYHWLTERYFYAEAAAPIPLVRAEYQGALTYDLNLQAWELEHTLVLDSLSAFVPIDQAELATNYPSLYQVEESSDAPLVRDVLLSSGWSEVALEGNRFVFQRSEIQRFGIGPLRLSKVDTITIEILPQAREHGYSFVPARGSEVQITSPAGFVIGTFPGALSIDTIPSDRREVRTLPVPFQYYSPVELEIAAAGRFFRNPLLSSLARASRWDVLGWLLGTLQFVLSFIFYDYMKDRYGRQLASRFLEKKRANPDAGTPKPALKANHPKGPADEGGVSPPAPPSSST